MKTINKCKILPDLFDKYDFITLSELQNSKGKFYVVGVTNDMKYVLTTDCPECGDVIYVEVSKEDLEKVNKYFEGKDLIQNIFGMDDRNFNEFLMTGICPECWEDMFKMFEEDSDSEI